MDVLDKRQVADLVKKGRTEKGYTQQELADRTGVTLRSIQRIEGGEVVPREYTIRLLEQQLGVALRVNSITVLPTAAVRHQGWSKARKWIVTIGLGLLIPLLMLAFLAQAARWPETDFERILLWTGALAIYLGTMWKVWK